EQPRDQSDGPAQVQRALQRAWDSGMGRSIASAAALTAADTAIEGLLRWHYQPDHGILADSVAFADATPDQVMHSAWLSGAPAAYALLRHGLTRAMDDVAEAGRTVLDLIASDLAPCGAFWDRWTPDGGRGAPSGAGDQLRAAALAEAALFFVRALALEPEHPNWLNATRRTLDFCLTCLDEHGNPGSAYAPDTGAVLDRHGTAGLLWTAALVEAAELFEAPEYQRAAERIGDGYAAAIQAGTLAGALEDNPHGPSSVDGYHALIALMALYGATGEGRWLHLARQAADWLLTFRWAYEVRFPAGSPLARHKAQTRGADLLAPAQPYTHPYGLICQRELLRLAELGNDAWYLARAADHLAYALDTIVLRDGQFGGAERRGMLAGQWYVAAAPDSSAGEIAPVSQAGYLGLLVLAAEEWADRDPALGPDTSTAQASSALDEAARIRLAARLRDDATTAFATPAAPTTVPQTTPRRVTDLAPGPVRLLPGLYQVGGGRVSHPRDASSYLLLDEATGDCLLVDCGSHTGLDALRANIGQVADLSKLQLVIGTHGHYDHVEAFSHLRHETDALFAIHHLDARAVRIGDPDLTCAGFLYNEPFHAFPVDLLLRGGERFRLGDYRLEILHLPGHTPGCIGVKLTYARTGQTILIPGDSIEGGFSRRTRSNVAFWKRSLRRLMTEQIDLLLPSHLPNGAATALLGDVPYRLARVYGQLETDFHAFMPAQRL
ncbi:MAG: MBL fold metallo-hydrolase, partial [Thermomicrobiales bacterium]